MTDAIPAKLVPVEQAPALDSSIVKARAETEQAMRGLRLTHDPASQSGWRISGDVFAMVQIHAERAISDAMLTHYQKLHNDRVAQCAALIHERDAARREVEKFKRWSGWLLACIEKDDREHPDSDEGWSPDMIRRARAAGVEPCEEPK